MTSSIQRVEKELQMIIQWERRSVELDVPVAEHKVNV
jgi:hypothetical protein